MMPKSTATSRRLPVDEQVALVHVSMEEAVAHRVAQEALDDDGAKLGKVVAFVRERRSGRRAWCRRSIRGSGSRLSSAPTRCAGCENRFRARHSRRTRTRPPPRAGSRSPCATSGRGSPPRRSASAAWSRENSSRMNFAAAMPCRRGRGPEQTFHARAAHLHSDLALAERIAHAGLVDLGDRGGGDRLAAIDTKTVLDLARPNAASTCATATVAWKRVGRDPADRSSWRTTATPTTSGPRGEELAELDVGRDQAG